MNCRMKPEASTARAAIIRCGILGGCLLGAEEFETNGQDYLKTLEVIEACYGSAMTGNPVLL